MEAFSKFLWIRYQAEFLIRRRLRIQEDHASVSSPFDAAEAPA